MTAWRTSPKFALIMINGLALTLSGILISPVVQSTPIILLKSIITLLILFVVYRFNDIVESKEISQLKPKSFLSVGIAGFFLTLLSLLNVEILGSTTIVAICFSLSLGIIYSIQINQKSLRQVFLVKNLLISLGWSALIPLGSSAAFDQTTKILISFIFIQVFVGSTIRDIDDIDEDRKSSTKTIPINLGLGKTLILLHILNLSNLLLLTTVSIETLDLISIAIIPATTWRFLTLISIKLLGPKKTILQLVNLNTCLIILLSIGVGQCLY